MKKRKQKWQKLSSMLMVLLLSISLIPASAFATDLTDETGQDTVPAAVGQEDINDADAEADVTETDLNAEETPEEEEPLIVEEPAEEEEPAKEEAAGTAETEENGSGEVNEQGQQEGNEEDPPEEEIPVVPDGLKPGGQTFKLNTVSVQFKTDVVPDKRTSLRPGRVWIGGQKTSMKVNWVNASNMDPVYGVIVLRATGDSKLYKQVKKIIFRKEISEEQIEVTPKTSCTDTSANKKNTAYKYRLVSYYVKDGYTYVSPISDWAAGQISTSKLKNAITATMNKKSAKLQSKETVKLKLTVKSPKTKFMSSSRRWSSSNTKVATVSKGTVTAKAPGTATIRCRLASGYVFTSKITVVGAFKPGTPKLAVDYATKSSITLIWSKAKNATSYDVYKSNDGLHWDKTPRNTTKTTITYSGLTSGHRYTFYVIARNVHKGVDADGKSVTYKAYGNNSNVLNQKAVVKRRPMTLTGFPTKKSKATGTTLSVTVKVEPPLGRKAQLQMKTGNKWVKKKTITLPKGSAKKSVKITFPNSWWGSTTQWRLVIPPTTTTSGYTSKTLKITATRYYQNPSAYVQIRDSISKHGYSHYVSPVLVNGGSTKSDHIEALIKTANKYKGDKYVQGRSGAPGYGIDESGLVMQACYGAGVDLWPISPSTRPYNCIPNIMNSKLKKITYTPAAEGSNDYVGVYRGDLIFFAKSKNATPIHLAIYTGLGGLIHADLEKGKVNTVTIRDLESRGYVVVGVRRIFN